MNFCNHSYALHKWKNCDLNSIDLWLSSVRKNKFVNSYINSRIPDLIKTVRDLCLFFSTSVTHLLKPKAWTSLKVDQKKHTCLTYGVGLVAYLLIIFSVSSCMISSVLSQAVLASCSTTQGSRATCDVLPAPAHDRASPIVNCTSTCRICSVEEVKMPQKRQWELKVRTSKQLKPLENADDQFLFGCSSQLIGWKSGASFLFYNHWPK